MRTKKMFYLSILVLLVYSCSTGNKYQSGKPYDVLDKETYNKIQQKYKFISDFQEGTSVVFDSCYGLINIRGKEILPCIYDTILGLTNKYRIICKNNKYGSVDIDGNFFIECDYEDYKLNTNDYLPFKRNNKWGFLDKEGNVKIQFKYENICLLNDSVFMGMIGNKWGVLRYDEKTIFEIKYDAIIYKLSQNATDPSFLYLNDKLAIANSKNQIVTDFIYNGSTIHGIKYFEFPQLGKYLELEKAGSKYGLINYETGETVIPFKYDKLGKISENILYAKLDDKYGYIDLNNQTVIPFKFENAENFSEGLARVGVHKGYYNSMFGPLPYNLYGFIDKTGKFVIEPKFPDPILNPIYESEKNEFHEGLAVMGKRIGNNMLAQKFGYINSNGNWIIEPIYDGCASFKNNRAIVKKEEKYGCINNNGEVIIDIEYDDYIGRYQNDSIIILKKDNIEYHFRLDGTIINDITK